MNFNVTRCIAAAAMVWSISTAVNAQQSTRECGDKDGWTNKPHVCEVRELSLSAVPSLQVDAGMNGGVVMQGDDRGDVTVRAVVMAWGNSEADARELEQKLRVVTDGGRIRVEGPRSDHYSVSFSIKAPHNTSVDVHAQNGAITIADLDGRLRFTTMNGGLKLANLAGDVKGETTNGGVTLKFNGTRWNGSGLDVRTTNGGIRAEMAENYAAHLEAATVNGGLRIAVPFTAQGTMKNSIQTDLGGGGPTIHLESVNGGVRIETGS